MASAAPWLTTCLEKPSVSIFAILFAVVFRAAFDATRPVYAHCSTVSQSDSFLKILVPGSTDCVQGSQYPERALRASENKVIEDTGSEPGRNLQSDQSSASGSSADSDPPGIIRMYQRGLSELLYKSIGIEKEEVIHGKKSGYRGVAGQSKDN